MIRVGGHRAAVAGRVWRIAALMAAGAFGSVSQAEAAPFLWFDTDAGYSRPVPSVPQRRPKLRRHQAKKIELPTRESTKPLGPLIIAISIEKQSLKIHDANGFFAETPISTGMKGHPTPMGVFSVIQKQKLHHSNIYSGAPMPYMQRITWSGVAIHAGVLPGYPASHGCIRMPMAFAVKMWNWTKMGARVVVTPGEITPASFSHPLLATQKVAPQPTAEPRVDAPPAAKPDKASAADTTTKPTIAQADLELRSTVGHGDGAKPVIGEPLASTSLREETHTADASDDVPANQPSVTMTDAASSDGNAMPREEPRAGKAPSIAEDAAPAMAADASKSAETAEAREKSDDTTAAAQPGADTAKLEVSATGSTKAEEKTDEKKDEAPADNVKAVAETSTSVPDEKKDQARLPDAAKPPTGKNDPATSVAPKRAGQIAVLISRKDSKLYVRQNFAPLFDTPVSVAPSDRPLGTHVFTAQIDKDDANIVHWSVISLPAPSRHSERRDEDERASRRRKMAATVIEAKPSPVPDSPTEALNRLTIPADAMARITEGLSTGASIIVSDQGISAGETGEGTDFIVSLR